MSQYEFNADAKFDNRDRVRAEIEQLETVRRALSYITSLGNIGDVISCDLHLSGNVLIDGTIEMLAKHINLPIKTEPYVNKSGEIDGVFKIIRIDGAEILQFDDMPECGDQCVSGGDPV